MTKCIQTRQAAIMFWIKNDQLQRMRIVGSERDVEHILLLAGYKQK